MVLLIPINFQNSAGELQAVFISFKSNCKPLNGLCRTESEVNRDFCIKRVMTSFLNTCNPAFFFFCYITQFLADSDASWAFILAQEPMKTNVTDL